MAKHQISQIPSTGSPGRGSTTTSQPITNGVTSKQISKSRATKPKNLQLPRYASEYYGGRFSLGAHTVKLRLVESPNQSLYEIDRTLLLIQVPYLWKMPKEYPKPMAVTDLTKGEEVTGIEESKGGIEYKAVNKSKDEKEAINLTVSEEQKTSHDVETSNMVDVPHLTSKSFSMFLAYLYNISTNANLPLNEQATFWRARNIPDLVALVELGLLARSWDIESLTTRIEASLSCWSKDTLPAVVTENALLLPYLAAKGSKYRWYSVEMAVRILSEDPVAIGDAWIFDFLQKNPKFARDHLVYSTRQVKVLCGKGGKKMLTVEDMAQWDKEFEV